MTSTEFVYNHSPGKLQEFVEKLQTIAAPPRMTTDFPKSIGFPSSHARGFPAVLKFARLLESSGAPTEAYKRGLRGGPGGRALVGKAIMQGYKALFDVYPDANKRSEQDLATFIKSHSNLDDEKAALAVKTFKVMCKFDDFDAGVDTEDENDVDNGGEAQEQRGGRAHQRRRRNGSDGGGSSGVTINVNIALSVDATSEPGVYDAFFAAMAKHLGGLMDDFS